jgi:Uma2 family endonuclease
MSTAKATRMTAEEFCDFVHRPENQAKWFELVRGEVIELPPPMKPHGVVCIRVGSILDRYTFDKGAGYVASNDSGVILERDPDTVRGPDVAVYNDASTFADLHPKYEEVPPLLAVEVLSPNDRPSRVLDKIADYLRTGVRLVWVIDPERRTVSVHQPDKSPRTVGEHEGLTGEDVLPDLRCRVADFFRLPGDKPTQPAPPPA